MAAAASGGKWSSACSPAVRGYGASKAAVKLLTEGLYAERRR
nr:hypothetical protein [Propionicimonas sp.]